MAIYSEYRLESTGTTFTSMDDFANSSVDSVIIRNDGRRYIKNSKGVWERADSADYFEISKLTIGNANGEEAATAGEGTLKYEDGSMFFSDGSTWNYIKSKEGTWKYFMSPDKGFVFGGYRNSVAWGTVNRINYSSDTTTVIGDLLNGNLAYQDGMSSKYNSYIVGVQRSGTTHSYTSSAMDKMNHRTETVTSMSDMLRTRQRSLAVVDQFRQLGYVAQGGSARIDKLDFANETWSDTGIDAFSSSTGAYGGVFGENYGHFNHGSSLYTVLSFSTLVVVNISGITSIGATRGMVCDENYAWHFGSSSTSRTCLKVSYATNTAALAGSYPATLGAYYQEVNNTSQVQSNTGYFSGGYNGTMVSYGGKFNATTETGYYISSLNFKGQDGSSSAATGWNYNGPA